RRIAGLLVADERPGDRAQALMDLGATESRPGRPACAVCPPTRFCAAFATATPARWPLKAPRAGRPRRHGVTADLRDGEGRAALVRRPARGQLGGVLGLPPSGWAGAAEPLPPAAVEWRDAGAVEHVFTHFALTLGVRPGRGAGDFLWTPAEEARAALPTVFRKALERGLAD